MSAADPSKIGASSKLLKKVIEPSVRKAGDGFLANLDAVTVADLCAEAVAARVFDDDPNPPALSSSRKTATGWA
jgi:hypothetical protein